MALFKSGNPTLQEKTYQGTIFQGMEVGQEMTINGTLNKFGILFVLMLGSTLFSWNQYNQGSDPMPLMMLGVFGGLGLAIVMGFKKQWSRYLAPLYAVLQGLFVGSVSAYYDDRYKSANSSLVMQAVGLTLVVTLVMYIVYRYKIIKVTEKFKSVIIIATASVAVFYLLKWVLFAIFHSQPIGAFTNAATPLGIGFSILVVCLAALNLLLNFDMIEKGVEMKASKYMEWYSAFGLLVTIVWLYLEILRLLSKFSRN
jgi:uncharacterized YccA/Bax inhibitor family protein